MTLKKIKEAGFIDKDKKEIAFNREGVLEFLQNLEERVTILENSK